VRSELTDKMPQMSLWCSNALAKISSLLKKLAKGNTPEIASEPIKNVM